MVHRPYRSRPLREPVRSPWVWVTMVLIILGGVPLYLPAGAIEPLVLGIPYWMALSVLFTLLFAAFTSWLCLRWWNLVEPEEEGAAGPSPADAPAPAARPAEGGAPWTT